MRVLEHGDHDAARVDPFRMLPCGCASVRIHITDGASMGDDLLECPRHGYVITLAELYRGLFPGKP